MRIECSHIVSAALLCVGMPAWSLEGSGLHPSDKGWFNGRWQSRIELSTGLAGRHRLDAYTLEAVAGNARRSTRVFGDFYFRSSQAAGHASTALTGFRASSGLIVDAHRSASHHSPRGLVATGTPHAFSDSLGNTAPLPYVGLGYTDSPGTAGWGFSADFGLMALSPRSAVKFGSALSGAQGVDDLLRDLRLSPLIQVGVSYSF